MTLLLDSALRATVILTAGWMAVRALRSTSADVRCTVWRLTILAVAALPMLLFGAATVPEATGALPIFAVPAAAASLAPAAEGIGIAWLPVVWAVGCVVVLARLAAGLFIVGRWSRSAEARREGHVRYAAGVSIPITWGAFWPEILLPAEARTWSTDERDIVVSHETAHISRHDWAWQMLSRLVGAVFWFHPLVWVADRGLRREAEQPADDLVLARGADPATYAGQLLKVARGAGRSPAAAVAMAQVASLEDRVRHLLRRGVSRSAASRRTTAAASTIAVLVTLSLSAVHTAQLPRAGEDGVTVPRRILHVAPVYPESAKAEGVQGVVFLDAELNDEGFVENIVVQKSPDDRLSQSAVDAVGQWRYEPATKDGEPVRVKISMTINYRLGD